ncbi:MAG TPA: hypothetical protein VK603_09750 [Candidatus Saccharimonadales bacterium]|nr:hypothetical protein [Candidatus Saccharimonadales bacterium]
MGDSLVAHRTRYTEENQRNTHCQRSTYTGVDGLSTLSPVVAPLIKISHFVRDDKSIPFTVTSVDAEQIAVL